MIFPKLSDGTIDWCVMCKHEGSNVYDLCCECEYPENSDDPPTKYEPQPKTNADKLRAMSDEELASYLCKAIREGFMKVFPTARYSDEDIQELDRDWLGWLRQEVTNDP